MPWQLPAAFVNTISAFPRIVQRSIESQSFGYSSRAGWLPRDLVRAWGLEELRLPLTSDYLGDSLNPPEQAVGQVAELLLSVHARVRICEHDTPAALTLYEAT